jgi:hypothetical protein
MTKILYQTKTFAVHERRQIDPWLNSMGERSMIEGYVLNQATQEITITVSYIPK